MISFIEALFSNPLLFYAIVAGCIASVVGGIIGSYVVVKRISFISGSIAHSVLAGIGLFLWLERTKGLSFLTPLQGALVASIASAWLIGYIHMNYKQREDSVIAASWSLGMAIGVLFLSQTPGFTAELANFLVGNILWVTPSDLWVVGGLVLVVLGTVFFFHEKLLALCFDEDQARLQGVKVDQLYLLLLTLIAITIVLLMQVVGIILVLTMLTLPPTIASLRTKKLSHMMVLAILLSCGFSFFGTFAAFHLDLPVGATIAFVSGVAYIASLTIKNGKRGI